ncbi:D-2-hydroxyacid dehydrogenase [Paucilactobacillus nenjiangensis]|jgi:D-lactate dehydrogenase|uniref:D-2-hydroxyacid dehydrogenase n=1 Tax=Paucilactobacillus nenjiangensis TaxID=1296540 RepID=UPI0010F90649|nr:D-2-hydroxyacid dehydrogenase [Paucilactobacillus nenjiangensis]
MKIIMYSVLPEEKPYVEAWSKKTGNEVTMLDVSLSTETVDLAKGYDGIDIQQTTNVHEPVVYEKLASFGLKQLTARMVGFEIINLQAATDNGLTVTNIAAYSPRAIAELGVTQAMRLIRQLGYFDQRMAEGNFLWHGMISQEIHNLTVGIIGAGHIGGASAQIYTALGAKVLAVDPAYNVELEPYLEYTDLDTVLTQSDIVSIHTPLQDDTVNIINADTLAKMKSTAYFINMARGGLVDTPALIKALQNHEIAGAALDTLADETEFFEQQVDPATVPDDYKTLKAMPNVMITPHSAFFTNTAIRNIVEIGLNDVVTLVNGGKSRNALN